MSVAIYQREKTASEIRNVSVSFVGKLDSGELLSGTPVVTEVTTSDLTLTSKSINTAIKVINGLSVGIGQAVQFTVSGGTAGTSYNIKISVGTDASQALYGTVKLVIVADEE